MTLAVADAAVEGQNRRESSQADQMRGELRAQVDLGKTHEEIISHFIAQFGGQHLFQFVDRFDPEGVRRAILRLRDRPDATPVLPRVTVPALGRSSPATTAASATLASRGEICTATSPGVLPAGRRRLEPSGNVTEISDIGNLRWQWTSPGAGELVGTSGLEPLTSCVSSRRSNQLSYAPMS